MPAPEQEPLRSSPVRRRWPLALALVLHLVAGGVLLGSRGIGQYFYDERFTLENVRRIYLQGHPVPTSYFWYAPLAYVPQAATLLAVDRLGSGLGLESLRVFEPTGELRPLGIRIARAFGILFGALTLIALHALCRRLWDAASADFGVLALAASPWFARGNAEFKPDALLVLLTVAGFVPLVRYLQGGAPRDRRFAAVAAGAAAAAKLNGVLAVVPLGLACLGEASWRRRVVVTLETAMITALSFLLLNPWPGSALYFLRRVDRQWAVREEDLDFLGMLATMSGKLFKATYLGPLFGVAAIAGLLLTLRALHTRQAATRTTLARALWIVYPLVYLLVLCASTRYPKENNLLPVLPFAAAFAGVGLAATTTAAARRRPRLAAWVLPAIALLGAAGLARFVLVETVEQAVDRQVREVRLELGGAQGRVIAWWGGEEAMREFVNSGWQGPPPTLLRLDAELAADTPRRDRLDCVGGYGEPPAALLAPLAGRFEPRPVGSGLLASRLFQRTARPWHDCRPWQRRGEPIALVFEPRDDGWFEAQIPTVLAPHDAFTLSGRMRLQPLPVEAAIGERPLALLVVASARQRWLLLGTERQTTTLAGATLRVRSQSKFAPQLELLLWAAPRPADGESG